GRRRVHGMVTPSRAVAFIPARAGSKRVKDKNIRVLAGHPMIAYTIAAARDSGVFDAVIVSTDAERIADVARHYSAEVPFLPLGPPEQPWHSSQYQALPLVYLQNASLEIAWTRVAFEGRTIAGEVLTPFFTEGYEGFDINQPRDLALADALIRDGIVKPPAI